MWISDLYQCAKTARTLEKWSQLPAPLKREVARNNFKLRLSPTAGTETSLLGYRIKFPAAGILKELYREVFVEAIYFFRSGKDDPIIIDCGSSIGVSVLFFKKLYPKSKIIAFEPDPFTFEILTENVKRNGLTNVELHQCALSDSDDPITFYRPLDADASSLRMNSFQPRAANSHAITVQAKR